MTAPAQNWNWNEATNRLQGERFTFTSRSEKGLVFDFRLAPGGGVPLSHQHAMQDEHFRCLEGSMQVTIDGEQRTLRAGETIVVPRGTLHSFVNPEQAECRCEVEYSPAGRNEDWFRITCAASEVLGRPLRLLEIAPFVGDIDLYIEGPPVFLQRVVFAVLKPLATALGYRRRMLALAKQVYGQAVQWT